MYRKKCESMPLRKHYRIARNRSLSTDAISTNDAIVHPQIKQRSQLTQSFTILIQKPNANTLVDAIVHVSTMPIHIIWLYSILCWRTFNEPLCHIARDSVYILLLSFMRPLLLAWVLYFQLGQPTPGGSWRIVWHPSRASALKSNSTHPRTWFLQISEIAFALNNAIVSKKFFKKFLTIPQLHGSLWQMRQRASNDRTRMGV